MTTRVSQACQRCRRRKLKCNGQPQCSSCRASNQICKYGNANRKRGLAEGYVRGLERLMGFAIRRDSTLSSDIKQLLVVNQPKQPESTAIEQETMLEVWKKSAVAQDIDHLVPALERGETLHWQSVFATADNPVSHSCEQHTTGEYDIFGADVAQSHVTHPHVNLELQDLDCLSVRSGDPFSAIDGTISNKSIEESERAANGELQYMLGSLSGPNSPSSLPENAKQMIDEYFAYTNCWMPILEPHEVLRIFHQCRNPHTLDRTGIGDLGQLAVLWAIFAFESHKGATSELATPTNLHESPIYKFARSLIPAEEDDHNLGHVQALLLLSMVNLGYGLFKSASFLVGSALRMILHIQIDDSQSNRSGPRISPRQTNREPHIIAGCCVLERLLALRLGYPVPNGTLPQRPVLLEDGLDEWETPRFPYLPLHSGLGAEMDTPGHILSTFNGFSRTVEVLSEHFANTAQNINLDMEKSKYEGILDVLQSSNSELSEKYNQSRYPQFFLHYMMNLSAVLALRCPQTKAGQRSLDSGNDLFLNSLITLPSLIEEFKHMYGARRIPVVLAIVLHQIHEDMKFAVQISSAKDKASILALFEALRQTATEFDESWPVMRDFVELFETSNTISSENDSSTQILEDAPALHKDSEHLPFDGESMNWNGLQPFPGYRTEAKASRSIMTGRPSRNQTENYGLANSGVKLASDEISNNIPLPHGLATVGAVDGVEDIYFQLAHPDITEWSGNWQQDGLRELGFDNNAFEQLYNGD